MKTEKAYYHNGKFWFLDLGTHKQAHPEVHYVNDIQVTMRRLDSLIFNHEIVDFDFLNIDVQGAELKVLKGMGELLRQYQMGLHGGKQSRTLQRLCAC
jgi:FkbM family methyltransferase